VFKDEKSYMEQVKRNHDFVYNDTSHGLNGWWMEPNINIWRNLYAIPQRTMYHDLSKVKDVVAKKRQAAQPMKMTFEV
jgi:hypothetical protein